MKDAGRKDMKNGEARPAAAVVPSAPPVPTIPLDKAAPTAAHALPKGARVVRFFFADKADMCLGVDDGYVKLRKRNYDDLGQIWLMYVYWLIFIFERRAISLGHGYYMITISSGCQKALPFFSSILQYLQYSM